MLVPDKRGVGTLAYQATWRHAPATVRPFRELWRAKGLPALPELPRKIQKETSLSLLASLLTALKPAPPLPVRSRASAIV